MDFLVKTAQLDTLRTDCLIVQVYTDKSLSRSAKALDEKFGLISQLRGLNDLPTKVANCSWVLPPAGTSFKRVLLVCIGNSVRSLTKQDIKNSAVAVTKALKGKSIKQATWSVENASDVDSAEFAAILAEAAVTGVYAYSETKTQNISSPTLTKLTLHSTEKLDAAWRNGLQRGKGIGEGINTARHLATCPAMSARPPISPSAPKR